MAAGDLEFDLEDIQEVDEVQEQDNPEENIYMSIKQASKSHLKSDTHYKIMIINGVEQVYDRYDQRS